MANPNIAAATSIYGRTVMGALTTSNADLTSAVASDKIQRVNTIIISNVDGAAAATATITVYNADDTTEYKLAHTISVPPASTLVVLSRDTSIYLEEGDKIRGLASANSDLQFVISYEELDDA